MVVKKKKTTVKKPVKKVEKKVAKSKVSVKKTVAKPAKKSAVKSVKKTTAKPSSVKTTKVTKAAKPAKTVKATKPVKTTKVVAKPTKSVKPVKVVNVKPEKSVKPVKAPVQKPAAFTANKKTAVMSKSEPAVKVVSEKIQKPQKPQKTQKPAVQKPGLRSVEQSVLKQQTTREQSKLKHVNRPMIEDMDIIETIDTTPSKKATTLLGALEFTPYQPKEGEVYMSEHQRDHFRKILNAWKQQLMQDVDLTVGHLKEDAVFYADPVDRASQEEGFNLELRTRDRERRLIKKIEQSLDLITNGEYGFCEDCGAEIGIRRLEARPTAVKCIDCKTFQEIREKQLGGG